MATIDKLHTIAYKKPDQASTKNTRIQFMYWILLTNFMLEIWIRKHTMKNWKHITTKEDVLQILERSTQRPQIIFKDSVTCGISAHAKEGLINGFHLIEDDVDFHYLDLLSRREVSNFIATELKVTHQSPQIILIKNKKVVFTDSHHSIKSEKIQKQLEKLDLLDYNKLESTNIDRPNEIHSLPWIQFKKRKNV